MARGSLAFVEHVKQKAQLAQEAPLVHTARRGVLKRHVPYGRSKVHYLQQRIDIAVHDVVLQTRVLRGVEMSARVSRAWGAISRHGQTYLKSQSSIPNLLN